MVMSEPACLAAPARRRGALASAHQPALRVEEGASSGESSGASCASSSGGDGTWEASELAQLGTFSSPNNAGGWAAAATSAMRKSIRNIGLTPSRQSAVESSSVTASAIVPPLVQLADFGEARLMDGSKTPVVSQAMRPVLMDSPDGDELSYMLSGGSLRGRRARLAADRSSGSGSSSLSGSSSYVSSPGRESPTSVLRPSAQHAPCKPLQDDAQRALPSRASSLTAVEPVTSVAAVVALAARATIHAASDSNSALRKALSSPLLGKLKVKQE
ncbi:hypothetical protein TSOC_003377 [Tetrabaena socialis]|uniref:Uncharacterized protein n=1 Tax=Tetrabaena socialis TaxID=47790 RepID=A0A2J8ABU5_9CHLO|nr:hypothetical protein TSOC_003377 [Tetrabaena socialis]|eukprot:PNH09967.1 hypothetical protein TSOC_003377 [Tetrabaena socialis]